MIGLVVAGALAWAGAGNVGDGPPGFLPPPDVVVSAPDHAPTAESTCAIAGVTFVAATVPAVVGGVSIAAGAPVVAVGSCVAIPVGVTVGAAVTAAVVGRPEEIQTLATFGLVGSLFGALGGGLVGILTPNLIGDVRNELIVSYGVSGIVVGAALGGAGGVTWAAIANQIDGTTSRALCDF